MYFSLGVFVRARVCVVYFFLLSLQLCVFLISSLCSSFALPHLFAFLHFIHFTCTDTILSECDSSETV